MRHPRYRAVLCLFALGLLPPGIAHARDSGGTMKAHGSAAVQLTRAAKIVTSGYAIAVDTRRGRVFTVSYNGRIQVFDAASGRLRRAIAARSSARGIAVDSRTGHVFIAEWGRRFPGHGSVSMIDGASGRVLRTTVVGMNPASITVDEATERVFVSDYYGVSVLDARSGVLMRAIEEYGIGFTPIAIDEQRARAFAVTSYNDPLGRPASGENNVYVLDAATGLLLRRVPNMHGPIAVAVDRTTGRIFTSNWGDGGSVSMIDPRRGAILRTVRIAPSGRDVAPDALAVDARTNRVFVVSYDEVGASRGHVSIIDARSGALLKTVTVGDIATAIAVSERTGRVFVVAENGVTVLDAASGTVLRTIAMSPAPSSMTIDETSARVYVSNGNGWLAILDAHGGTPLRTLP